MPSATLIPTSRSRPRAEAWSPHKTAATVSTRQPLAYLLAGLEAEHGDRMAALDSFTVAIHNYHESGNNYMISAPLALLAAFLDRLGHYESAATIAAFSAINPMTAAALPELGTAIAHLREVLGDQTYQRLARESGAMTALTTASCNAPRPRPGFPARRDWSGRGSPR